MTMDPSAQRQQVLFLYLEHSGLDGRVVAWSFHDGSGRATDLDGSPPYATGTGALRDGWRLLQASPVPQRLPGAERVAGRLEHELVFERIVDA
ncbi:hypothetical protein NHL50_08160 [Acidimicrobiia bacterium EGI L10123]|uniref:hypothetical protein n=1 Tax=Salinilacustrithrix flava TaxID=2957203 RepID=UPI003D7C27F7|nr:hypothetical protein [Acidimicrobiia bacterium EGI L10123]